MTSRERLLNTLRGGGVDRIPISLYEFDGFYDSWIGEHREYKEILEYAEGKTDKMYFWGPERPDNVLLFGEIDPGKIRTCQWKEKRSLFTKTTFETPRGELCQVLREDEGIHTAWCIEHPCKDEKDGERLLSLPFVPWKPSTASFFRLDRDLGDRGIVMIDAPDALCLTVDQFGFFKFLTLYVDQRDLIFRMMDFFQERICAYLKGLLEGGAASLYRIVGPEYATPPYLPPKDFEALVTSYDAELVKLIRRYGGLTRLHSHGKVGKVLEACGRMGIDAMDPLEPPPDGDVGMREARRILGEVTLIGNVEERIFETGSREEVEAAVRQAVEEGRGGGFILCPTAMPLTTPLERRIQENIIHYIDSGLRYGAGPL